MNWDSFAYQYVVGGLIFFSIFILAWRSGDYSWKNKEDRYTSVFLLLTFLVYLCGQLIWQLAATGVG